jgi:hypothetical protein
LHQRKSSKNFDNLTPITVITSGGKNPITKKIEKSKFKNQNSKSKFESQNSKIKIQNFKNIMIP